MERKALPHRSKMYTDLAGLYDHVFTRVFARRIHRVIRGLNIPPGARVLEIGVGTGASLDAYPPHCSVIGIDLSEDMLEQARAKLDPVRHRHIELRQMDALNLEFESDSFDYVTAFHVVTVVPDPNRLIREMTRVCKPDGEVVIINHFSSPRRVIRGVVNLVDPITRRLGWSTKLSLDDVMRAAPLSLQQRYKTSPWSLFTIVQARKFETSGYRSLPRGPLP
ncbi:MAG: methyltransferase domain-containing protein [Candidatus Dadabacteria bacterium]|nr:MAG: methyltransferase domain-containing protein [Candidatus Dadabacteria bacterium]